MIDFFARQIYYLDHLAPVWNALPDDLRGEFFITEGGRPYAGKIQRKDKIREYTPGGECGQNPVVAASYGDAVYAAVGTPGRRVILMEHGVGLTFGKASYADGLGQRSLLSLFLMPSAFVANRINPELKNKPHPVIGIPKMDPWHDRFKVPTTLENPTLAISFHHGDRNSRPGVVGSAWEHYISAIPDLKKKYRVIAHGHAMARKELTDLYTSLGIEIVNTFDEVMQRADIYINDASSTAYEFLLTGKPVILLNAPWFDKTKKWGLRFWDHSNIGLSVDDPKDLPAAIEETIKNPSIRIVERRRAVQDLFPFLGRSSAKAVEEITKHLGIKVIMPTQPEAGGVIRSKKIVPKKMKGCGVLYMCFGSAARIEMEKSIRSLRGTGCRLSIAIIADAESIADLGSVENEIDYLIPWDGPDPFDASQLSRFHFRAGYVKPEFYRLSPFTNTLYVDADTIFYQNPEVGFGYLDKWDFVIAQERLTVNQLYNRPRAGWEHNLMERDATIEEFGGDGNFHFWNSGVFFFKKSNTVKKLFDLWRQEWRKWKQWDEQLALMRAANNSQARVWVLAEIWNHPHSQETKIIVPPASLILHLYGRAVARSDKGK